MSVDIRNNLNMRVDLMKGVSERCDRGIGIILFLQILSHASAKVCANGCKRGEESGLQVRLSIEFIIIFSFL
jgi:hypothetical protein